jgi:peptidoglycan/LPS O-acetylase OafA/YrhL
MEIIDPNQKRDYESRQNQVSEPAESRGRVLAGIVLLVVGCLWLANAAGIHFPDWLFEWPAILVAIGLFMGARNNFAPGSWIVLMVIGMLFWFDDWLVDLRPFMLPLVAIIAGVYMIAGSRPNRHKNS